MISPLYNDHQGSGPLKKQFHVFEESLFETSRPSQEL